MMNEPADPLETLDLDAPRCPYCSAQPCGIGMSTMGWKVGPAIATAVVFICASCRAVLSVTAMPQQMPAQQPQPPLIVIPGGLM